MRNSDFDLFEDERFNDSRARIVAAVNARYTLFELFNSDLSYCDDLKGALVAALWKGVESVLKATRHGLRTLKFMLRTRIG